MKALTYGFGLLLVGGFALTASCGGSSADSSGSTAGTTSSSGGTVGNTTGGRVGNTTGGTVGNTTGGTVGNTTGGTGNTTGGTVGNTGGTGNTTGGTVGNTGGTGTGGGTTMNPAGCPATAPAIPAMGMPGATCTPLANPRQSCSYVTGTMTETCTCRVPGQGGPGGGQAGAAPTEGTWRCQTMATPIPCSATPMTGQACTGFGCGMRGSFCACTNGALVCQTGMGAAGAGG